MSFGELCKVFAHKHTLSNKTFKDLQTEGCADIFWLLSSCCQGGKAINYTSPQSFIIMSSYLLAGQLWGLQLNFDWFVHYFECSNVATPYCNIKKVYQYWGYTSIYRPLSYP